MALEHLIGKKAPAFKTIDQQGKSVELKDYLGQKVALYFYPQDDTPTCTTQACNLRDNFSILKTNGITILGISPDEPKSHTKFISKFKLPFTLLADSDNAIAIKYGVWRDKKFMGREYIGMHRTTFLIDEKGKIKNIIEKVLSKKHAEQILELFM